MTPFQPPDQEEVERALSSALKGDHGKISRVAGLAGLHRSQLSRYVNPEHPDKSPVFLTMMILEACRYTDATDGKDSFEEISALLLDFINSRRKASAPSQDFAVSDLTLAINSYFDNAPYTEQLKATRRALATLQAKERELMDLDCEDSAESRPRMVANAR